MFRVEKFFSPTYMVEKFGFGMFGVEKFIFHMGLESIGLKSLGIKCPKLNSSFTIKG